MERRPDRLTERRWDVLIVGGGITGTTIARDAALRGLAVALVERDDFAAGTSSRSSKLAHGGLRYLEHGHLGLVAESVREREALLRNAPHLVRALPFLLPSESGDGWPPMPFLKAGLWLYDRFAGGAGRGHRGMTPDAILRAEPSLAGRKLRGGALYHDAGMDDARLVIENAIAAAGSGAVVVNHVEVTGFSRNPAGRVTGARLCDRLTGATLGAQARLVVNAGGPWGDAIAGLGGRLGAPLLRPTKGVHLVYAEPLSTHALTLLTRKDRRVFFVLPWLGLTLIGTTDTDHAGDPGAAASDDADIDYLLDAVNGALPGAQVARNKVLSTFAGVRPLLAADPAHPSRVSREHAIRETTPGLLAVLGGKFTTARAMAEQAVDRIETLLGVPHAGCRTADLPLPGGVPLPPDPDAPRRIPQTPAWGRLLNAYGSRTAEVIAVAESVPGGLDPVCPHGWRIMGEIAFAARHEMAMTMDDVLVRRLNVAHTTACRGTCRVDAAAALLGKERGWDAARISAETDGYRKRWAPLLRF